MTEIVEQELREFVRLKHHSHELKNQQLGQSSLFRDQGVGGSNPLSPTNLLTSQQFAGYEKWDEPLGWDQGIRFVATGPYLSKRVNELSRTLGGHFSAGTTKRTYILPDWSLLGRLITPNWRNAK
jgi:hypothetical protein